MYGSIITATGWTYEYVDGLSLNLAVEFLEYQRRTVEAQNKAMKKTRSGSSSDDSDEERYISSAGDYSPEHAQEQTQALQKIMGPAEKLPEHLRAMIDWAEKEKALKGMS